jgi:cyanophycinase-like exopeptidase
MQSRLFLMGGAQAIDTATGAFVRAAGGENAVIVLLLQGGSGWERYLPFYADPLYAQGARQVLPIAPDVFGHLNVGEVTAALDTATAVLVGGGDTENYWRLYSLDLVGAAIRSRVRAGMVYGGLSAGADLAPQICAVAPEDTPDGEGMIKAGLGLVPESLVSSHFKPTRVPFMVEAMQISGITRAWGLEEETTAVFVDGCLVESIGPAAHLVELLDRQSGEYRQTKP